jgi:hypothetical protein
LRGQQDHTDEDREARPAQELGPLVVLARFVLYARDHRLAEAVVDVVLGVLRLAELPQQRRIGPSTEPGHQGQRGEHGTHDDHDDPSDQRDGGERPTNRAEIARQAVATERGAQRKEDAAEPQLGRRSRPEGIGASHLALKLSCGDVVEGLPGLGAHSQMLSVAEDGTAATSRWVGTFP